MKLKSTASCKTWAFVAAASTSSVHRCSAATESSCVRFRARLCITASLTSKKGRKSKQYRSIINAVISFTDFSLTTGTAHQDCFPINMYTARNVSTILKPTRSSSLRIPVNRRKFALKPTFFNRSFCFTPHHACL